METKVQNSEVKNHIEIGGAIITPEAIDKLSILQKHGNECISYYEKTIGNTICIFVQHQMETGKNNGFSADEEETMQALILLRDVIRSFRKP